MRELRSGWEGHPGKGGVVMLVVIVVCWPQTLDVLIIIIILLKNGVYLSYQQCRSGQ